MPNKNEEQTPLTLEKTLGHLKTITLHKLLVARGCFAVDLVYQGLTHDLSKYAPTEFLVGARYYQGNRSPNNAEREEKGFSQAWIHHKGRNRHHYEYWYDYALNPAEIDQKANPSGTVPVKMPGRYVVEMFMDRIAACKVYKGAAYTDSDPLAYFCSRHSQEKMHPETAALLKKLLIMLSEEGEEKTFAYIRQHLVR